MSLLRETWDWARELDFDIRLRAVRFILIPPMTNQIPVGFLLEETVISASQGLDGQSEHSTSAKTPLFRLIVSDSLPVPRERLAGKPIILGLYETIPPIDIEQPQMAPARRNRPITHQHLLRVPCCH